MLYHPVQYACFGLRLYVFWNFLEIESVDLSLSASLSWMCFSELLRPGCKEFNNNVANRHCGEQESLQNAIKTVGSRTVKWHVWKSMCPGEREVVVQNFEMCCTYSSMMHQFACYMVSPACLVCLIVAF